MKKNGRRYLTLFILLALAALLAMQTGEFEVARQRMAELLPFVEKGFGKIMGRRERSCELVVAWTAAEHPELQFAALDLTSALRNQERVADFTANDKI